jgi:undecaprenyl-diphosphatase
MKRSAWSYHLSMGEEPPSADDPFESLSSNAEEIVVSPPRAAARARWAEIVFLAALSVYAVLAVLANHYAYFEWDLALARRIQSLSAPGFDFLMTAVSLLGNGWIAWPLVTIVGVMLIKTGLRVEGLVCLTGTTAGWAANRLLKLLIGRPRPSADLIHVAGRHYFESFPSGHVVFFVEFFGFLFFLAYVLLKPGRLRTASLVSLGALILLVGVSRVYLGAHWPSDVVGAYLAGGIWLMLMIEVYRQLKARQQN